MPRWLVTTTAGRALTIFCCAGDSLGQVMGCSYRLPSICTAIYWLAESFGVSS